MIPVCRIYLLLKNSALDEYIKQGLIELQSSDGDVYNDMVESGPGEV